MDPLAQKVTDVIEPTVTGLGYRLVQVRIMGGQSHRTLQIMAERISDGLMEVGDCEAISRALSPLLDVEEPIKSAYSLEVSSPGIDRPLVRIEDYAEALGHEAKVETLFMVDGRKKFRGVIQSAADDKVTIMVEGKECALPFDTINNGKLILTDALIDAHMAKMEAAKANAAPEVESEE